MADRSSAPYRVPGRTGPEVEEMIERLRRLRWTSTRIAAELGLPTSTVGAVLARLGLNRLSRLDPPEPANRYWRRHPGELVHIDVKRLARFRTPGHRVTGRGFRRSVGAGWEYCHVAVNDTTRLAYVEVLENERAVTAIGFLRRALTWFSAHGVTVERGDDGQRVCLQVPRPRPRARPRHRRIRPEAPADQAIEAPDERKGREIHPDPVRRMGLRRHLL